MTRKVTYMSAKHQQKIEASKGLTELGELRLKVATQALAERLWDRVLTANQRRRFGDDFPNALESLGTVGMWRRLYKVSESRAVIEIAQHTGLLDETDAKWLLREIGERPASKTSSQRPSWQAETGELSFRGKVIRKFRVMESPTNLQRILDAFEAADWPLAIANPLGSEEPQATHQALNSLKKKLRGLRFHSTERGKTLNWASTRNAKSMQSQRK
jgi:hypothetical protein